MKEFLERSVLKSKEGENHIRAIRGHEAQRERAQRHLNELLNVLQLLMSSLSVPPRLLNLLRDPSFSSQDISDLLNAIRTVDKVVTLKDLDQRLLKMRAVSDRAAEYKQVRKERRKKKNVYLCLFVG